MRTHSKSPQRIGIQCTYGPKRFGQTAFNTLRILGSICFGVAKAGSTPGWLTLQLKHRNLTWASCRTLTFAFAHDSTFALAVFEASKEKQPDDSHDTDNCQKYPSFGRNHFVDLQPERAVTPGSEGRSGKQDAKHHRLQHTERHSRNFF